jgi:hypothetical protein
MGEDRTVGRLGSKRVGACLIPFILLAGACTATPSPPSRRCGGWRITPSPNPPGDDLLFGVWGQGGDVWAVGSSTPAGGHARTLIERRQGGRWRVVPSPNAGSGGNYLLDIAGTGGGEAWAVGQRTTSAGVGRTLVVRWDGSAWNILPSPNIGRGVNVLTSVAVASAVDVWVAGYHDVEGTHRSLVFRWNGARWFNQSLPPVAASGEGINSIAAGTDGRVWAVGGSASSLGPGRSMLLSFDGRTWHRERLRHTPQGSSLSGVAVSPDGIVWAVGAYGGTTGDRSFILSSRGAWPLMPHEPVGRISEDLNDVATAGGDAVWAAGSSFSGRLYATLIEYSERGHWSSVTTPNLPRMDNRLLSVVALPGGDIWAVGSAWKEAELARTLVLHGCSPIGSGTAGTRG